MTPRNKKSLTFCAQRSHPGKSEDDMPKQNRTVIKEPDKFDVLSAAWVLACNDEIEIMTYEGIRHRLSLSKNFDVKGLIQSRGDLFRRGLPQSRLQEWKNEMLTGYHRPSWIVDIDDQKTREDAIKNLTTDDVFRSQFRAEKDSPRSPVQLIDWGLKHIDRIRKANLEFHEQLAKSWQIWLVFAVNIIYIGLAIYFH